LSKSFWGGLRIGWVRGEADVVRQLTAVAVRSTMSGPVVEQLAACVLLDGAEAALADHRRQLRQRRAVLVGALRQQLPAWRVPEPAGGLVLWCGLPERRSHALVAAAQRHGLHLAAGPLFGTGHALDDRLRLPFTQPPDVLEKAVTLLVLADAEATGRPGHVVDRGPVESVV
jgi:DNA-binding transcriptional MocR family regulator